MPKEALKKEKWTLSFNGRLKHLLIREARKQGMYPVHLLEQIVRERFNPFGYADIKDGLDHLKKIRSVSRTQSDDTFLKKIREWQRLNS